VDIINSIRRDQLRSESHDIVSNIPANTPGDKVHTVLTSATSEKHYDGALNDIDDDLDTDLAKAALDTGTNAFELRKWKEADSLLQEALRVLQQIPQQQRAFCNLFGLQYKLAICAYHLQEPTDAEEALMSLVKQPASSDEQRRYIADATHLLSYLYIRMGQIDRARYECTRALQARRRLLGKRSNASLESTALMAHLYFLLDNHARAKSYLAMIPEENKDTVLANVEESLNTKVENFDTRSLLTESISEGSDLTIEHVRNRLSAASLSLSMDSRYSKAASTMISQSSADNRRQSHSHIPSHKADLQDRHSVATSLSSAKGRSDSRADRPYSPNPQAVDVAALSLGEAEDANEICMSKTLSRREILDKIGCQPRDQIEEAVCNGDNSVLASLLTKKTDFLRSKLRKRVRAERVTALHFAALFGEVDMARRLIVSNFKINEVPFGYTTSLTPLKFAIGARQVDMVDFLIANGAKPSEPDSWSTLAGQLMNRSWLMKTMSEAEREYVPDQIIMILRILLKYGWAINTPVDASGGTVLHQAVTFWTGSYRWDLNLRAVIASFLCEEGADPFRVNAGGKTPYDLASASGNQDLLLILDQDSGKKETDIGPMEPVELSC